MMSKDVSIFNDQTQVIASNGRRGSALGQQLASSAKVFTRRIQTSNKGIFRKIINGEQVGDPIRDSFNAIIVGMLNEVSRVFYEEKYDPNKDATAPNCFSNSGSKPEPDVSDPQHSNCADCPQNIKGSGENGGKACRYQRRIAILLEGDTSGDVYQFSIPAKSLFGKGSGNVHPFESYFKYLVMNREAPDTVVTTISYDINADGMELLFSPTRQLTDAELDLVEFAQANPETQRYTRITVAQADGVTKLPRKVEAKKEAAKPAPKVTRSEEPDDDEPMPEPVKRTKAREEPEAEAVSDKLASVISEWGGVS
jgi:hypothetical protein